MIKGEEGGRADFMEEAGWGGDGGASGGRKVGPGREARRMGEPADPETGLRWPGGSSEVSFNSPGARDRALGGGSALGECVTCGSRAPASSPRPSDSSAGSGVGLGICSAGWVLASLLAEVGVSPRDIGTVKQVLSQWRRAGGVEAGTPRKEGLE